MKNKIKDGQALALRLLVERVSDSEKLTMYIIRRLIDRDNIESIFDLHRNIRNEAGKTTIGSLVKAFYHE